MTTTAIHEPLPAWVEHLAPLPVAFAQVREDPRLDLWVTDRLAADARVIMIASGGCTAAALAAATNVAHIHLVDPNPAQMALARLKLRLLQTADPAARRALLGHAPMTSAQRRAHLTAELAALHLPTGVFGDLDYVARVGPDHAGRYEGLFAALQDELAGCSDELQAVLCLRDPVEQRRRVAPSTVLGRQLDEALDTVMALPNLVRLFGEEATRNAVEPFSRHFAHRLRHVLTTLPAAQNPYLWQMLRGRYPTGCAAPWLMMTASTVLPEITWSVSRMADALQAAPAAFDFVHLSNILDWLSPEQARTTLELAHRALRPGGCTLVRQLNSSLDIPALAPTFTWQVAQAKQLHAGDRSFFYRDLHLGKKL